MAKPQNGFTGPTGKVLISFQFTSHWSKEITWSSPISMGQKSIIFTQGGALHILKKII
jgi:hypothetical protein